MKVCSKCKRPFDEPHPFMLCNSCREYNRRWKETHHEQCLEYDRRRIRDREKENERRRQLRKENPTKPYHPKERKKKEAICGITYLYRVMRKEGVICLSCNSLLESSNYKTCKACRKKKREKNKGWREHNRETKRECDRRRRREHPEMCKIHSLNHYFRKKGNGGRLKHGDIHTLFEKQNGLCFYCGRLLYGSFDIPVHIEHKIPVSRGGRNDITNVVLACATCNFKKRTKTDEEFLEVLQ